MPLWRWVKELKLSWSRGLPQKLPRRSHSCGAAPVPAAPHNSCPVPRAAALPVHNPSTVRGWPSPHNARIHGHGNALRPHASGAADPSHCNTESALGLSAVSVVFFLFFFPFFHPSNPLVGPGKQQGKGRAVALQHCQPKASSYESPLDGE